MLQIDLWKRILIWGTVALGLLLALPNAYYSRVEGYNDQVAVGQPGEGWVDWLPSNLVNLGLDLRGGAHLLAEVKVEDVYASRMKGLWPEIRNRLRQERDVVGTIRLQDGPEDELRIRISNADAISQAVSIVREISRPIVSLT
ncbi:MAG: protein translocase subunit SecD, partial [Pseudomonadota bacterium]|nr:protein translocase subunit SecD [Pseudomonadota bacterium]